MSYTPTENTPESPFSYNEGAVPPLIVIGRQTGSGGRCVGKLIAERMGMKYFDKELFRECADRFGYSPEVFESVDEKRPSMWRSFLHARYGLGMSSPMNREELYRAQSEVIRNLAAEHPTVIVGRTADYIMRDHPGLVSIFIHAPLEWRISRLVETKEFKTEEEAKEAIRNSDSTRRDFYNYFTGRSWGEATNYDLTLNSSDLSEEDLVDVILKFASRKLATRAKSDFFFKPFSKTL